MQYQIVAEAYRDLEAATARLALIDRLAALLAQTPTAGSAEIRTRLDQMPFDLG